jgi:hypothetical protein
MRISFAAFCLTVLLSGASRAAVPATADPAGGLPPANLRVEKAADTVILTDGTKITGTILAAGLRAVIIIEKDQTAERVIKRSEIESFSYAAAGSGEVRGYTTGVRPEEGLPVIVGEGTPADSAATPQAPIKPKGPAPAPKSGKDLSKLWSLLGGNASVDDIKAAIAANPQWQDEIRKLMAGEVPPEGADAVAKFKERMARDPELRKHLDGPRKHGRLPGNGPGGNNKDN